MGTYVRLKGFREYVRTIENIEKGPTVTADPLSIVSLWTNLSDLPIFPTFPVSVRIVAPDHNVSVVFEDRYVTVTVSQ